MIQRSNSFDLLRLAAAVLVVGGHACVLAGTPLSDPLARWTGVGGLGAVGVSIFFVLSGFLVTASFTRRPNVAAFATARALRILPALVAVVVLTALAIGPALTTKPLPAYAASAGTWLYMVRNVLILPVDYHLPGLFETNPYAFVVNGSLWTLRLEVAFYLLVAALGWRGWLTRGVLTVLFSAFAVGLLAVVAMHSPSVQAVQFLRCGALFLGGAAAWTWRGDEGWADARTRLTALGILVVMLALATSRAWGDAAVTILLPLPILALGSMRLWGARSLAKVGDLSYGVYLWAFPVTQGLVQVQSKALPSAPILTVEVLLIVLPLAWLSWRLLERPCLALKPATQRWLARFDRPIDEPDVEGSQIRAW